MASAAPVVKLVQSTAEPLMRSKIYLAFLMCILILLCISFRQFLLGGFIIILLIPASGAIPILLFRHIAPNFKNACCGIPITVVSFTAFYWLAFASNIAIESLSFEAFNPWHFSDSDQRLAGAGMGCFVATISSILWLAWPRAVITALPIHCSQCGYDLRGSLDSERCPECGRVLEPGKDIPDLKERAQVLSNFTSLYQQPRNRQK